MNTLTQSDLNALNIDTFSLLGNSKLLKALIREREEVLSMLMRNSNRTDGFNDRMFKLAEHQLKEINAAILAEDRRCRGWS